MPGYAARLHTTNTSIVYMTVNMYVYVYIYIYIYVYAYVYIYIYIYRDTGICKIWRLVSSVA